MNRTELEHIIRAAGAIADVDELIVVGSQAVLGQFPNAPPDLLSSREADVYPRYHPERSDLIESAIGYESQFERTFGYYADGVDETTAVLPHGWRDRLILVSNENTRFIKGWCLEVHDLAISKYVAGREKDIDFCRALAATAWSRRRFFCSASPLRPSIPNCAPSSAPASAAILAFPVPAIGDRSPECDWVRDNSSIRKSVTTCQVESRDRQFLQPTSWCVTPQPAVLRVARGPTGAALQRDGVTSN